MNPSTQILQWLGVLPAGLIAALLISFPVHWVVMLIQAVDRPDDAVITIGGKGLLAAIPPETLERFAQALLASFAIVAAGAWIAPRCKFRTAIVLAVAVLITLLVAHIVIASQGMHVIGGPFQRVFTHLLQIAGLSWGVFYAYRADKST